MNICLGEIARCQQVTPRPNFIVLLGDRYGWLPLPSQIRVRMRSMCFVPSRQGAHFPHDSSAVKVRKNLARSTMQVAESSTIIPPEPIIEPASASLS